MDGEARTNYADAIRTLYASAPSESVEARAAYLLDYGERELVLYIIRKHLEHMERENVRKLEASILPALKLVANGRPLEARQVSVLPRQVPDELRKLMRERFALGDGLRIEWGEATAEQHEQRAEFFERAISGHTTSMRRHLQAAEVLRSTGARCLNELIS